MHLITHGLKKGTQLFSPPFKQSTQTTQNRMTNIPEIPPELLEPFLDTIDFVAFLMVCNPTNRYVVVEALAGCGKTAMLMGLVNHFDDKDAMLLLSFTKQAITIARVRSHDGVHVQTFDSLFYQTVKHGVASATDASIVPKTYETFRDISETLTEKHLEDFVGQTHDRYAMNDIQYILVDEAQDTPPQAYQLLETFRGMGKTIVITGDRHQAIFGFMRTQSLFDMIPSSQKYLHYLRRTRRCCPEVVDFLNARFHLNMESAYTSTLGPQVIDSVCVQAQHNATLGRLYAKFLFTMDALLKVSVSEGDSAQRFWDAVHLECSRMYAVTTGRAKAIVEHRQQQLAKNHRLWAQTPRHWRTPMFVFATVHHFKGGECDVTVLGEDVDIQTATPDLSEERMKYVAGSRARWGIVDLRTYAWKGHPSAQSLLYRGFLKSREKVAMGGLAPRISSVSDMPTCIVPLILSPTLSPWVSTLKTLQHQTTLRGPMPPTVSCSTTAMKIGALASVLVGWTIERNARCVGVPHVTVASDMGLKLTLDRKYTKMTRRGDVDRDVDAELRRILARRKIQAALGRYLIVFHNWPPASLLSFRAALAKAQLQSFAMCCSVTTLERRKLDLVTNIRVVQILDQIDAHGFPGLLGRPDTWWSLNVRQPLVQNPSFFFRGIYDVLIVTKDRECHVVNVRTVRTIGSSLVLQTVLYRTVLGGTFGMATPGQNHIYECNRNELCTMDTHPALQVTVGDDKILPELDSVLFTKILPQYYPSELAMDTVVGLL